MKQQLSLQGKSPMQISNSKILLDIIKAARKFKVKIIDLSKRDYEECGEFNASTVIRRFGSWEQAKKRASKCDDKVLKNEIKQTELDKIKEKKQEDILEAYISLARQTGAPPKLFDLSEIGISRDSISRVFGSVSNLDSIARKQDPDAFNDVYISSLFSPKLLKDLDATIKNYSRFIITTAVNGCKVHKKALETVKQYCSLNNAALLILTASDPAHNLDRGDKSLPKEERYGTIDKILKGEHIILKDVAINNNLRIDTIKISAKQIDPITGISRLGQRNGTLIVASPKQRQKLAPVSNCKLPHPVLTSGAITVPDYNTTNYMSEKTAKFADGDHQLGAIIVEVEDSEIFHYRQVQFDQDGCFYEIARDKALLYSPTGVQEATAAGLILGDWHSGETDPLVAETWKTLARIIKPAKIFIHDGFNGISINHHEENNHILRAQRALNQQLSLEAELRGFAADLDMLSPFATESLVIVKSNHDDFLNLYLKECKYCDDPQNHYVSLKLALAMMEGLDPLQHAIEDVIGLAAETKVRWLKRSEDCKIARIQLNAHGDKGPNGSKGTLASMEASYGQCITGHTHSPEILRGAWSVGTSSYLKLTYNEDSPSTWMNTSCILWPNGQRQLINSIAGNYRLKDI